MWNRAYWFLCIVHIYVYENELQKDPIFNSLPKVNSKNFGFATLFF